MTPLAYAEAALAADHAHADPAIWITRLPDEAVLAQARKLEDEGPRGRPLWGVPFAVKDNVDVVGLPTTAACPAFAYTAQASAPAVQRLLDGGALLVGKTNLDQFAAGLVGTRTPYGVPRNLFDPLRVPGGSSSGSACAVAAGIVRFAIGTDTAGSGRVPAAFGNIVGLKPTLGSVPTSGVVPACRSVDTVSVFGRSVDETLAVLRVMAGDDPDDPYSRAAPFPHLRRADAPPFGRVAMADVAEFCEAQTQARYQAAAQHLQAETVDIALFLEIARLLYDGPWVAERTAVLRGVVEERPDILYPATRQILQSGFNRRSVDAFDAFHRLAEAKRAARHLFRRYDALLLPTAPICPLLAAVQADPIGLNKHLGTFTNFVNLCDLAGYAVPAGFGTDGLPVGVMLLGPAWSEGRLAGLADQVHRAFATTVGATGQALPSPAAAEPVGPEETALFCIGAHMSGLPQNHQIIALGGRFVCAARTQAAYRLYALANRPGMVRAADGAAVEGEIWALPTAAIGVLLGQVPPPLGFGTVALEGGPCLGFLAEAGGVSDAADITRFRGWRAWLQATGRPQDE
ncbi:MAG TPA: allophanate hydrolase [Acetobacteraceae bacterium]|nr:allophanate hydrolase [Acetobacteraceae bacterium]